MAEPIITKSCSVCHETKPLEAFPKQKLGKFGRQANCKACVNVYAKRKRALRRESLRPPTGMKMCSACQTLLPLERFNNRKGSRDGLTCRCRECINAKHRADYGRDIAKSRSFERAKYRRFMSTARGRHRLREKTRRFQQSECGVACRITYEQRPEVREVRTRYRKSDRAQQVRRRWKQSSRGREVIREGMARYRDNNPHKTLARRAVNLAVRKGSMPRADSLTCRHCGQQAKEYHHWHGYDVEHRLDVIPLCISCHDAAG